MNDVTEPAYGVAFELTDAREWQRPARATRVEEMLAGSNARLRRSVDFVIGLVTSLPTVSSSLHGSGPHGPWAVTSSCAP